MAACEEMASEDFSKAEMGKGHLRTGIPNIYPSFALKSSVKACSTDELVPVVVF